MDRKHEILQQKINTMLARKEQKVITAINTIEETGNLMRDFIAPLGKTSLVNFTSNGNLSLQLWKENEEGGLIIDEQFGVHDHAISQAGEKLGVPTGYLKKLATQKSQWGRDLSAHILNEHSYNTDRQRVLVRSVGSEIRGILSDHYRRLNTTEIYGSFFTNVANSGGVLVDAFADATRTYVETILPKVIPVPTEKNGVVYMVFGMRISNSDFGDGALNVQAYSIQVACMNGMTRQNLLRQIHLGKRLPDNISLSEQTYKLDTEAQASLVGDVVSQVFSADNIERQAVSIQEASAMSVDLEKEVKKLPMLKQEVEAVEKCLMANREDDGVQGEGTLWKLSQAVTAVARDQEDGRRQREIEDVAGKLFDRLPKKLTQEPVA